MSLISSITDVLFGTDRGLEGLIPNVVIEEAPDHQLLITDHPVDRKATITDNAVMRPTSLRLRYGWSPSAPAFGGLLGTVLPISAGLVSGFNELLNGGDDYLADIYTKLRKIQSDRIPFVITTGKMRYPNMLLQQISFTTSKETEYSLMVNLTCREINLVDVQTTNMAPKAAQANPAQTAPLISSGSVQPGAAPAPNQSLLLQGSRLFK